MTCVGLLPPVNVAVFPESIAQQATSLRLATGQEYSVATIEATVRSGLIEASRVLSDQGFAPLLDQWRMIDVTAGLRYTIDVDGNQCVGTAEGIDDSGALLLRMDDGEVRAVVAATSC